MSTDNELRCSALIEKVRDLPGPSVYLIEPGRYTDDEIRVANDSLRRLGNTVVVIAARWTLARHIADPYPYVDEG